MLGLALATLIVVAAQSAPADKSTSSTPAGEKSLGALREDIGNVLRDREVALRELNGRLAVAPLDQRVALETEAAQIQTDYERRYLELVVDYHRLSGNTEELARAERMLESLNAGVVTGTPLPLERNLRGENPPSTKGQEGVVTNGQ
jgi:hypothetical protein